MTVQNDLWLPDATAVLAARRETHDVVTLTLDPPGQRPFEPGQFNMLYRYGLGECAISISGDPARPDTLQHTVRAMGALTRDLCGLKPGDVVGIRGPFGTGWPVHAAEGDDVVFVAGGLGLAPLRPAILHVLHHRERYGRVVLLYGARGPDDLVFEKELHAWRGRFDMEVRVTVDRHAEGWRGPVGVVTRLVSKATFEPSETTVMTCGPEIMMRFVISEFVKHGVAEDRMYISMERNMRCAVGLCGHCQWGPQFVCKDGPVFRFDTVRPIFSVRQL